MLFKQSICLCKKTKKMPKKYNTFLVTAFIIFLEVIRALGRFEEMNEKLMQNVQLYKENVLLHG